MKFKAYVLSPNNATHGGYVVIHIPPFAKTMDDASDFVSGVVKRLVRGGINVETWFVEVDN